MFSFHKPRVYRSSEGCCICRAKSSSSRFTDSRKYECDLPKCFNLSQPRQGEICNACVLLVKRYKLLPPGSTRHWGHVVDARAGPGTKSQSKHKKHREDAAAAAAQNDDQPSTSAAAVHNNSKSSLIPEKFSKIFKKNKKSKTTAAADVTATTTTPAAANTVPAITPTNGLKREGALKRKAALAANAAWESVAQTHSTSPLPGTPDSLDSDYEDNTNTNSSIHRHLPASTASSSTATNNGGSTIVQFQTQTRASSYRSRNTTTNTAAAAASAAISASAAQRISRPPLKTGSKRRQMLSPRKNRRHPEALSETAQFFDASAAGEWQPRKSCCGLLHECEALGGALLIDVAHFKRCVEHSSGARMAPPTASSAAPSPLPTLPKTTVIATLPTIVQLAPPPAPVTALPTATPPIVTATPVLKKHHLYFKRQSECFPQGGLVSGTSSSNSNTQHISTKTELGTTIKPTTLAINLNGNIVSTASSNTFSASQISSSSSTCAPATTSVQHLLPRHSAAKITTITPMPSPHSPLLIHHHSNIPSNSSAAGGPLQNKSSHNFIHKIKADAGKIVKHSLNNNSSNKLNSATVAAAVRLRPADLQEMNHAIKMVDNKKSYVLAAAAAKQQPKSSLMAHPHHPAQAAYIHPLQPMPNSQAAQLAGSAASSSASQSPSGSTKFSDNSSDSGFDENMLDRKSASPLHEEHDRKVFEWNGNPPPMLTGKKTMIMHSGVILNGDVQNLLQANNEATEQLLLNRKKRQVERATTAAHAIAAAVAAQHEASKLDQDLAARNVPFKIVPGSHPMPKMRSIYNNNHNNNNHNAIQHENGVTTIVPASSLAASSQTAAMNALTAPSTVTITPAPTAAPAAQKQKLTNLHIASNINHRNHAINSSSNLSSLNQKIILVKSAAAIPSPKYYNSTISASGVAMASTTAPILNNLKKGL